MIADWLFIVAGLIVVVGAVLYLRRAEREHGQYDASDDNDRGHW